MPSLSKAQLALLGEWLGSWDLVADHSWPLQDTTVLHVRSSGRDFIVKASETSHHIAREIAAHRDVLGTFGRGVPALVEASDEKRMLLAEYLPGALVEGTPAELNPETYAQAGAMLSRLLIPSGMSHTYVSMQVASVRRMLPDAATLLPAHQLHRLDTLVAEVVVEPVPLSFTHGDYQPRNWLMHEDTLSVIDFGRAAKRHWTSELVRLQNQQFAQHAELEEAFMKALDRPFTDLDRRMMALETMQQSLGTVVWAHGIGDDAFEEQGRRMIDRLLGG